MTIDNKNEDPQDLGQDGLKKGGDGYVPVEKFNAANDKAKKAELAEAQAKELASQLSQASKELEEFKKRDSSLKEKELLEEKKYQELLTQKEGLISDLQTQLKQKEENFKKSLFETKLSSISNELKARDVNDIKALIKESDIELKDGVFVGLEDKIKKIKEDKPYLFHDEKRPDPNANNRPGFGGQNSEGKRFGVVPTTNKVQELLSRA